jgi:hypothetical protein
MGAIVPPPPPTFDEFRKRLAAGATTMEELDPAFAQWYRMGHLGLGWLFKNRKKKDALTKPLFENKKKSSSSYQTKKR